MPDFERLKSEQAMNEEKVVEFYKASFKLPTSYETENLSADGGGGGGGGNGGGGGGGSGIGKSEMRKDRITLPPTDRLSQVAIRFENGILCCLVNYVNDACGCVNSFFLLICKFCNLFPGESWFWTDF